MCLKVKIPKLNFLPCRLYSWIDEGDKRCLWPTPDRYLGAAAAAVAAEAAACLKGYTVEKSQSRLSQGKGALLPIHLTAHLCILLPMWETLHYTAHLCWWETLHCAMSCTVHLYWEIYITKSAVFTVHTTKVHNSITERLQCIAAGNTPGGHLRVKLGV